MRTLILGGTAWLGREVARSALARGHEVTCLARGESGAVPDGAVFVQGDREHPEAYDAVQDQHWDAVVDVSRQPGQVRRAVAALEPIAAHFVFVSSGSVYSDTGTVGADEQAALLPALEGDVMESMETYGEAKVACESAVLDAFGPSRVLIARSGLIGGPGDETGRTGYWPLRFARPAIDDGRVLVVDSPGLGCQVIDVRDLALWLVTGAERALAGVFNAMGETLPLAEHLAVARDVAGHTGELVPVSPEWLEEHGVEQWSGERSLPLWLPLPEYAGFNTRDSSAARAEGLECRALASTLADTLAWEESVAPGPGIGARRAGLSDAEERELLGAAAAAAAASGAAGDA